ncbi:hypothetical protein HDV05_003988 [Chytridiales sp. JEL 0842]|nr:hypothetical protein HDV05_003988 [Chytridiales sp. JEL 0842]
MTDKDLKNMDRIHSPPPQPASSEPKSETKWFGFQKREWHRPEVSPEAQANFLSRLVFAWLYPLLRHGHTTPLDLRDLYPLNDKYLIKQHSDAFEALWKENVAAYKTQRRQFEDMHPDLRDDGKKRTWKDFVSRKPKLPEPPRRPTLAGALFTMFKWKILPVGIIKFLADVGNACSPFILQRLISFVKDSNSPNAPPISLGLLYAIGLFCLNMYSSISISNYFQRVAAYGMVVRGMLTSVIHRKSLRLSGVARQEFNPGRVANMISTDLVRIDMFIVLFHLMWTFPLQVSYIVGFLISIMGPSALGGVFLLLAMVPLQAFIIGRLVLLRKSNATNTDQRVKLTSETLLAIRVIKFFAWEDSFLERIFDIRARELKAVVSANLIRSAVTAFGFAIPVLAASVTFMIYSAVVGNLDPVIIFTSLAFFNQLRNPIMWTPLILSTYADASVGVKRIEDLLYSEELDFVPDVDPSAEVAVRVVRGDFVWESKNAGDKMGAEGLKVATSGSDGVKKDVSSPLNNDNMDLASLKARRLDFDSPKDAKSGMESKESSEDLAPPFQAEPSTENLLPETPAPEATTSSSTTPTSRLTLENINIAIPPGSLVAIVGAVGSGKSSLLSSIVGQLKPAHPSTRVIFSGSVGYVPQQAWIMNSTLRDNILFGLEMDEEKYQKAVEVCALKRDLEILAGGDMAEIGERGINLSGGQKQRVSLARLVYFDSDIVLLDDPLSAVDTHVGKYIFENCICGALKNKTRLLVTHQLHFASKCDIIITMKNGKISEMGSYSDLITARGEFCTLMQNYGGVDDDEAASPSEEEKKDEKASESLVVEDDKRGPVAVVKPGGPGQELMKAEDRATGALENSVFVSFAIAMGGVGFVGILVFCLLLTQVTRVANDLWLVKWSSGDISGFNQMQYMWTYFGLGMSQAVSLFIFSALVAIGATTAAKHLQQDALRRIVRTPIRFFDTNPMGRIINRFSRDQDIVDNTLPDAIRLFSLTFATAFGTFGLVAFATSGWFFVGLLPMLIIYYFVQDIYRSSARELKRLDALTRSPLYAHITESMSGVATIRAYGEQDRFLKKTDDLIDGNNMPYYLQATGQRWLGMRLESIGNVLVFVTALFSVLSAKTISPALIGLALSYVLQVTQLLSLCIRQYTEAEVQLVSIERLHYYAKKIVTEAPPILKDNRPPPNWPSDSTVEFDGLSMRYQEDLPLVLRDLTFSTRPNEKIGIVGRTGSGKSSLIMALFRMVEASAGRIVVDGVDINKIGLYDLRSRLSIIPQDPILFSGTIRSNLDPFNEHTDLEIWEALGASGMKEAVSEMEGVLEAPVTAAGDNLSVGQRQLMCLARALLRKPKLIVLDECTANVDFETDSKIQIALRENLKNATILTIAHRLNTIIDSDRVLVLDNGQILEFDTPAALMANDGTNGKLPSQFLMMINETGASNAAVLKGMVKKNV